MNFKNIALRKKMGIMPIADRIIGPTIDPEIALEKLVVEVQAQIRRNKELWRTTFLGMVPEEHRDHVEHIAETAYRKRGITNMTYPEFRELIAENWLIKRAVFARIASDFGFKQAARLYRNAKTAALILTKSASIVVISKPEGSVRSILYIRIKEREANRIPPFQMSPLKYDVVLGERVTANELNSSPVIDILVDPNADLDKLQRASETMSRSFQTVDRHTIVFGAWNGNGDKDVN